ncbi:hypothetical protein SR870_08745 [Rhodopseudomonas palustris]|uniref:hypothetical protein n=1 Tax=Rhodopseudomonas palustris TaxID=1076 RepID=UPI002ACDF74F|nr:hypothetical protein [Rhodopseudomonas palustris]WQH01343.1 hypothetical protein SR870_08745 [Rhodopseudomonas palustris]
MNFKQAMFCGLLVLPVSLGSVVSAGAEIILPGASLSVSCANGGNYVLQSGPVASPGEIVTARLYLKPHRAVPMRLIPMGDGYRYAGRGIWLDGIGQQALLYRSKYQPTPCVIGRN